MTILTVKHHKVSTKRARTDNPSIVDSAAWNDSHDILGQDVLVIGFPTIAAATADEIDLDVDSVVLAGYYAAGDGGGGLYARVGSEPAHNGKFQSHDGAWWELSEDQPTLKMFGAIADGVYTLDGWKIIRGAWVTAAAYAVGDIVFATTAGVYRGYKCLTAHTSGTFATDLAAAKWVAGVFTGTDNIAAMQSALDYCGIKRVTLRVPKGDYRFGPFTTSFGTFLTLNYSVHAIKADQGARFFVDDGEFNTVADLDFIAVPNKCTNVVGGSTGLNDRELFRIEGLTLQGSWLNTPSYAGASFTAVENFTRIESIDCRFYDCRAKVNRNHFNQTALWDKCHISRAASGGFTSINTPNLIFTNLFMSEVDDDIVWPGTGNFAGSVSAIPEQIVVNNIIAEKCQNIIIGPARNVTVSNVNTRLAKGLTLGPPNGTASNDYSNYNIALTTINVRDSINGPDLGAALNGTPPTALLTADSVAFSIYGSQVNNGSTAAYPEMYDSVGGSVVSPLQLDTGSKIIFQNTADGGSLSSNPGFNTTLMGFNIIRTLPTGGNYSAFGYGLCFSKYGYFDPSVGDNEFARHGIQLNSRSRNVAVIGGNILGFPAGAGVNFFSTATGSLRDREFEQILLANINMRHVQYGVTTNRVGAAATNNWRIRGNGLSINCDPYAKSSARTSPLDGTWQSGIATASRPIGLYIDRVQGWEFFDCTFLNCYDAVFTATPSDFRNSGTFDNIKLHCDPAAVGFSTSNKGIGNVLGAGAGFEHIIDDCSVTGANWGLLKNTCPMEAAAMPSSGTYVQGHIVRNTDQTSSVTAWRRATTGSSHTLNIDWFETRSASLDQIALVANYFN